MQRPNLAGARWFELDDVDMIFLSSLPRCLRCGDIAGPNILMLGDAFGVSDKANYQHDKYLNRNRDKNAMIEYGASTPVPTVRYW